MSQGFLAYVIPVSGEPPQAGQGPGFPTHPIAPGGTTPPWGPGMTPSPPGIWGPTDPRPGTGLPGHQPHPDQGLPGQPPVAGQGPGFPTPPIVIPPPYGPDNPVPPEIWPSPGRPTHPIVLPEPPSGGPNPPAPGVTPVWVYTAEGWVVGLMRTDGAGPK